MEYKISAISINNKNGDVIGIVVIYRAPYTGAIKVGIANASNWAYTKTTYANNWLDKELFKLDVSRILSGSHGLPISRWFSDELEGYIKRLKRILSDAK